MSDRAAVNVALWARLYRLLADRDEYMREDRGERIDRTDRRSTPSLSEVDAELVANATTLDRHCGRAVRMLRREAPRGVLDLLGGLPEEQLAAIAHALPERRRKVLRRDPYWARAIAALDEGALHDADQLADDLDAFGRRMDDGLRRKYGSEYADEAARLREGERRLMAGLPHELSLDDLVALYEAAEADRHPRLASVE